ncbi:hypothetical protein Csa_023745 [Cucumis sativus]|nr:hypothetical protein Csa_023745 [Cucumis sativus]
MKKRREKGDMSEILRDGIENWVIEEVCVKEKERKDETGKWNLRLSTDREEREREREKSKGEFC